MPWISGFSLSAISSTRMLSTAASGDSGRDGDAGPRSVTSQAMPTLAAVRDSDRTYQALASSAVAVTTASVGVRPAAVSSAAWAAVSA
jgi:hypothetical protein